MKMNWNNIDLNSNYEKSLPILDSYDSETLLLEIACNVSDINRETVKAQVMESLQRNFDTAVTILNSNLDNYVNQAIKERNFL